MLSRMFVDHPRAVGESYLAHARVASHFGVTLLGAGLACLVHALVPGLFRSTGSGAVERLYQEMIARRRAG
ncbi:DUF6356 family protein [Sphingomonas yunnanensis]|uniref:DUF6356 family protein n=1 Tax=Sphingomonas yunnanensis TaxID=310400 RepID=UPI001CA61503|nr:DUF6356 family protein [Sphingomonas yunnanensis]MBY9063851.1 DUF6356 family protein [Sphingomonas yunnanensis]